MGVSSRRPRRSGRHLLRLVGGATVGLMIKCSPLRGWGHRGPHDILRGHCASTWHGTAPSPPRPSGALSVLGASRLSLAPRGIWGPCGPLALVLHSWIRTGESLNRAHNLPTLAIDFFCFFLSLLCWWVGNLFNDLIWLHAKARECEIPRHRTFFSHAK